MSKFDRITLFMSYIYILAVLFFTQISSNNNFRRSTMGNRSQDNNNQIKERRTFARNLKKARLEAKLTQEDLVEITGLTQPFISEVENAKSTVSLDNAHLLAKAVGQPLWKLLNCSEK